MSKKPNTPEPSAGVPEAVAEASALADEADELLASALSSFHAAERDLSELVSVGALERVLALYGAAIRLDPEEPAYPWNLGSALSRLGLDYLALGFIARAIQLSGERGEEDWSGPAARLALAEVAIDAGADELALTALAHTWASDKRAFGADVLKLLEEIDEDKEDPEPQTHLAGLLKALPRREKRLGKGNDSDRYVVPNKQRGGWDVVKERHGHSSAHTSTKKEAVDRAREIVKNQGGGEIRIANKDGRLVDRDTVSGSKRGESSAKDRK